MRIISKFSDYYDCIMKMGMDKTIVYNRKEECVSFKENLRTEYSIFRDDDIDVCSRDHPQGYREHRYIIGFCGKIYPVAEFKKFEENRIGETIKTYRFFYSNSEYMEYEKELYNKNKKVHEFYSRYLQKSMFLINYDFLKKYFVEYKTPIFIIRTKSGSSDVELVINCSLKEYEFYKIYDPYSAFQEIQMYISGVLGVGQPQLIQIGNKEMIQKKGFDKWSFRKMPEKVK